MTSIKRKLNVLSKNSLVSVDIIKKSSSPYIVKDNTLYIILNSNFMYLIFMSQKIVKVQICQGKDYNPHNRKYPLADNI